MGCPHGFLLKAELSNDIGQFSAACVLALSKGFAQRLWELSSGSPRWSRLLSSMNLLDLVEYVTVGDGRFKYWENVG